METKQQAVTQVGGQREEKRGERRKFIWGQVSSGYRPASHVYAVELILTQPK